ncbi:MAG: hypothetical protein H6741_03440 [Alphaproteobacteria bacterium]|nr:hypothetical protein [Alphaproteobacteria bacterium]MCB9791758.1 hypothetical protein [Alphaproteobacteria bacterium]
MSESTAAKSGNLPITLATWMYILFDRGHVPTDAGVRAACEALAAGVGDADADFEALGRALVASVEDKLGADASFAHVRRYAAEQYGEEQILTSFGESREERARGARRYGFSHNLPWIARIIDRFPNGEVGAHWVMVEQVTDVVTCMDPYPWDDLDEEYEAPVTDFMVKWELAGARSLRFK